MKSILKNGVTSAIIGLTAFVSPALAERAIRLNIPVRVDGDLSKVTDGIWLWCGGTIDSSQSYTGNWTAQISEPGTTFVANAADGTYLTTIEFVPSDLIDAAQGDVRYDWIDIKCTLHRGAVIPAEQLQPSDRSRTARYDSRGYPIAPAGPGSCGELRISIAMPTYDATMPKLRQCL